MFFIIEPCSGQYCRSSTNFVAPLIISLVAILLVVLVGIFIVWFYLGRRNRNERKTPIGPPVQFNDRPRFFGDTNDTLMIDKVSSA